MAPTAVPGVYRFDGNWVNLTGTPSLNRQTVLGGDPFDADSGGPPQNAGPDDDYRIMFPQSDATWSDILLIQRGAASGRSTPPWAIPTSGTSPGGPVRASSTASTGPRTR